MSKVRIKVISIGHLPFRLDLSKVKKWNSAIFEIIDGIETFALRCDSDGADWEYSDEALDQVVPKQFDGDILVAILNVPLEDNFYSRRLSGNRVIFTFHQIRDFLLYENIPLENAVFRILYSCALVYKRAAGSIPSIETAISFTHDETRGCVFDMNGIKYEIVESCNSPIICQECRERLVSERVSTTIIDSCASELKQIKKPLYYRILEFTKHHPILSLMISTLYALFFGIVGSIIASAIYTKL